VLYNGITYFQHVIQGSSLHLFVDNAAVIATLEHGRAHAFQLNRQLVQVLSSFTLVNEVTISYICTNENPADSLSRGHGNKTREELGQLTSGAGPLGRWKDSPFYRVTVPE